jgi:hypothetical protein
MADLDSSMDSNIAITFEMPPYLRGGVEFDFEDPSPGPFKISHNTPLVSPMVPFEDCAETLSLHPRTASILDDIRFLIATVVSMPDDAPEQSAKKLQSTAHWIHQRIAALPADSPDTPRSTSGPPPPRKPSESTANSRTNNHEVGDVPMPTAGGGDSESGSDSSLASASASASASILASAGHESLADDSTSVSHPVQSSQTPEDPMYQTIRLAALIYTSAIVSRQPFSKACSPTDFYELWTTLWRVSLSKWKSVLGIYLWIIITITPTSRDTAHGRFVKSMLTIAALNLGLENWNASNSALRGAMRLQAWLAGGKGTGKGKEKSSNTSTVPGLDTTEGE